MFDRLVELIIQFIRLFQCMDVIMGYQNGLRFRLGKVGRYGCKAEPLTPGFYCVLPFGIDEIKRTSVTWDTMDTTQSFTSSDRKPYIISTVLTFKVGNIVKFWLNVENAESAMTDTAEGEIASYLQGRTWEEIYSNFNINEELTKLVGKQAAEFGLRLKRLRVSNLVLDPYNVRILGGGGSSELSSLLASADQP